MKRFCSFLAAMLIFTQSFGKLPDLSAPAYDPETDIPSSGKCGDNITWNYDADSETLTLEGSGEMYDYDVFNLILLETLNPPGWFDCLANTNTELKNIVIGDGITYIGSCAFEISSSVTKVTIPDSVTHIGDYAFALCNNLQTVQMSKNIKEIGDYAFYDNEELTSIDLPEGLESIGEECFRNTPMLSELNVPDSVSYIGNYGLTNCAEWFKSHQDNDFLILGDGVLYQYFGNERSVTVPDQVKSISGNAFHVPLIFDGDNYVYHGHNNKLESIVLPDSVTELPDSAFSYMSKLCSVKLPKALEKIGDSAFEECTSLTALDIPETVTSIGSNAFAGCTQLADMQIPSGVESVGKDAFDRTAWLRQAGDYVIVGNGIFVRFQGEHSVVKVPDGARCIASGAITDDSIAPQIIEILIPDTVTEIQPDAINSKQISIAGTKNSAAERYAADYDMPFRDINAFRTGKDMSLDFEKDCWSFANSTDIFGENYYLTDADRQQLLSYGINPDNVQRDWSGSCTGLALTVILMKNNVFSPADLQADANALADVKPTEAVQSFINYYHCIFSKLTTSEMLKENQKKKIYRMLTSAENVKNGESPFLLTFQTESGAHAVVGYGLESGEWTFDGKRYDKRVLIWDPNTPNELRDTSCVYCDSETLEYCIPQFGVQIINHAGDNVGGIEVVCNDLSILNAYPYPEIASYPTGDVNLDGSRDVADAVLLARYLAEDTGAAVTEKGKRCADCNGSGSPDHEDIVLILKAIARLIQL